MSQANRRSLTGGSLALLAVLFVALTVLVSFIFRGVRVDLTDNDLYTISANLAGLPAISFPCGLADGLPVGLQLTGNYFNEARLLNAAHQYQLVSDWHLQRPSAFA